MTQDNTKALATQEQKDIKALLSSDAMKKQIALALPKHMTADRMARVALTAINKTPKLLECTKESLMAAIMTCSQFGLEPDGRHAHLIPYGNQCQLILDYKGLVALMRRSGDVSDIHADFVGSNDDFDYCFGTGSQLKHKPNLKSRGEPIAFYSYVRLKDGSESFEVLGIEEVDSVRKRSRAGNNGPWVTDYNEMGKKTAFRRHSKWLPLSTEVMDAINADDDVLPVGENARFEKAKPIFGSVETPSTPVPTEPMTAAEVNASVSEENKATEQSSGPSLFEQVQILCSENGRNWEGVLPALKKIGQLPTRASISSLRDVTDEKLQWVLTNFDKISDLLEIRGVAA